MNPRTAQLILRLLDMIALGASLAPEIMARYRDTSAKVRTMVEEGRDPTQDEWGELDAETEDLFRKIQDA
jgi:hypothetical protein